MSLLSVISVAKLVGLSLRNITCHKVTFDLIFRAKFWALFTPVHHHFYPRVNKRKHPGAFKLQTLMNILLLQASVTQDYEVRLKKNCCPNKLHECVANFCCFFVFAWKIYHDYHTFIFRANF